MFYFTKLDVTTTKIAITTALNIKLDVEIDLNLLILKPL